MDQDKAIEQLMEKINKQESDQINSSSSKDDILYDKLVSFTQDLDTLDKD